MVKKRDIEREDVKSVKMDTLGGIIVVVRTIVIEGYVATFEDSNRTRNA